MSERPALSLIFPVFNEQENIGFVLDATLELAPRLAADFEIVVVDDGSRDGSAGVIAERAVSDPRAPPQSALPGRVRLEQIRVDQRSRDRPPEAHRAPGVRLGGPAG